MKRRRRPKGVPNHWPTEMEAMTEWIRDKQAPDQVSGDYIRAIALSIYNQRRAAAHPNAPHTSHRVTKDTKKSPETRRPTQPAFDP